MGCHRARSHSSSRFLPSLVIVAGLSLIGCGSPEKSDQLKTYPTSGQVTVKGKPVSGVVVILIPAPGSDPGTKGLTPTGTSDKTGQFIVSTYAQDDGAPAGSYQIVLKHPMQQSSGPKGVPAAFAPQIDGFGGKYVDPSKSKFSVTITEGQNVIAPIALD